MADMLLVATLETCAADPKTYKQAMRLPDATNWLEACAAEVASLVENKVYEVVDRPASHQIITSKWVLKHEAINNSLRARFVLVNRLCL